MSEGRLLVAKDGHVCTLTLSNPKKKNAISPAMFDAIIATMRELGQDDEARTVVLRGEGDEFYSAGYDIGDLTPEAETEAQINARLDRIAAAADSLRRFRYPVICMIYGIALGAALEMAVNCDFRFVSEEARFAMTPAKLGIVYRPHGIIPFMNLVGVSNVKEVFLSGRIVGAPRALQIGLVNHVLAHDELATFTYEFAHQMAGNAPISLRGMKRIIEMLTPTASLTPEERRETQGYLNLSFNSEDYREAQRAFYERRTPTFVGR